MKRTISGMLGKGSISHNTRQFTAANIDAQRTKHNIAYCNTPIRDIYHELFDDALQRYNAKKTRSDRRINDYYEKIRTGKQEKLFHEIIMQIGDKDTMSAVSEDGQLAAKVLDEYMRRFQERNPNLKVFSAHLHMDEATPHLHIDFVSFTTGSKRGLDTRVSLKQALATQGFFGGTCSDTERDQWSRSEKEQLSQVMERYGIEWEQLDTHDEHLSVIDYKKVQRTKEVAALEETVSEKRDEIAFLVESKVSAKNELDDFLSELEKAQDKLKTVKEKEVFVAHNARHYADDPEYELRAPKSLMSAKSYHEKIATPLVGKLKDAIRSILLQYFEKTQEFKSRIKHANNQIWDLSDQIKRLEPENERLRSVKKDFDRLRQHLGGERVDVDEMISAVKAQETAAIAEKQSQQQQRIRQKRTYAR